MLLVGAERTVWFSGADYWTVRLTVAVCVLPPPVPVIVMGKVPVAALRFADIVMMELPDPVIDEGLKLMETPFGAPEADNEMENELLAEVVTVTLPDFPRETVRDEGAVLSVKVPVVPVTVRVTVVVAVVLPEVPVTVIG